MDLPEWTDALWSDTRVHAAWQVAAEAQQRLEKWKSEQKGKPTEPRLDAGKSAFTRFFRQLVNGQSVPENIPYAEPWAKLEKRMKVPAKVKQIRGKLNVPRERFHTTANGQFRTVVFP